VHRLAPALAAVALLTATACGGGASDDPSPTDRPTPSAAPTTDQPTPTDAAVDVDAVVDDFLSATGSNSERAWELLTPRAQQTWGSFATFEDSETEFAEGLAAFAGVQERERLEVGDDLVVVVVQGEVTREGMTEYDAYPVPVRIEGGSARVELMGPETVGAVQVASPPLGSTTVEPDTELSAYAPAGSQAALWLDADQVEAEQTAADGDRTQLTAGPELSTGRHVVTVTAVRADGLLLAQSVAFEVS
jgi:hypothetical protein